MRTACGGLAAMRSAMALAASSKSASGTTRLTSPMRSASAASTMSPVSASSAALAWPTTNGSSQAPPSPGMMPSFTKLSANLALSPAMRTSHMQARSQPAPMAGPFTAATTGTSSAAKARGRRWMPVR